MAIHPRFLSLFPIFISLSPSLHPLYSSVAHSYHDTARITLFTISPQSISDSSLSACLRRDLFLRGHALLFCCIFLSICRARSYDVATAVLHVIFEIVQLEQLELLIKLRAHIHAIT